MDSTKPIVKDAIRWYQEQAWRIGTIGFSQDFIGQYNLFNDWKVGEMPVSLVDMPGGALNLIDATQKLHNHETLAKTRHTNRMRAIEENTLLQADVRCEVNRRLLEAGKTQQEILENTMGMSSLTMMTAYLYNVEHPPPSSESRYRAYVYTNFRGTKLPTPILLSAEDDFPELLITLKEFVLVRAESIGIPVTAHEDLAFLDSWRYRLALSQDGVLKMMEPVWMSLASTPDYRAMLTRIVNHENETAIPVLMPVHPVTPWIAPKAHQHCGQNPSSIQMVRNRIKRCE